jgi:hypothetical protein
MFTLVIQALKAFLANLAANIASLVMEALRRTMASATP